MRASVQTALVDEVSIVQLLEATTNLIIQLILSFIPKSQGSRTVEGNL
jgi:hypothetical protein